MEEGWYRDLEGLSAHEKLKTLTSLCYKRIKVCARSNRWLDDKLSDQLKMTRRTKKGKEVEGIKQEESLKR